MGGQQEIDWQHRGICHPSARHFPRDRFVSAGTTTAFMRVRAIGFVADHPALVDRRHTVADGEQVGQAVAALHVGTPEAARDRSPAVAPIDLSQEGSKDDAKPSEHLKGACRAMG
jgi:hypothetical protein